jgi:hypothetical protein
MNTEKLQLRHALLQIWNTSTSALTNPSLKQSHKSSLIEYETFGNPGRYTACVTVKLPTYAPVFPSTGKFNSKIKAERNAAKIALSWITKKQHEGDDIKETEVLKGMQAICLDDDDNLTKNTKLKQAQKIVKKLKPQTDPHVSERIYCSISNRTETRYIGDNHIQCLLSPVTWDVRQYSRLYRRGKTQ